MTTVIYATATDLATWTGSGAPSNATALLRAASMVVRLATQSTLYAADDSTGLPINTELLQAFKDATCAHAAALAANNIDPAGGAALVSGAVQSSSIGSASVTYAVAPGAAELRQLLLTSPCTEAAMILQDAGLLADQPLISRS